MEQHRRNFGFFLITQNIQAEADKKRRKEEEHRLQLQREEEARKARLEEARLLESMKPSWPCLKPPWFGTEKHQQRHFGMETFHGRNLPGHGNARSAMAPAAVVTARTWHFSQFLGRKKEQKKV